MFEYLRHPIENDEVSQTKDDKSQETSQNIDEWNVRLY